MALGFSTVTVVTDERRVDLALPCNVPVGEWFPELLRLCNARADGASAGWALGPIGGPELGLDATLETAGISDGQVLQLRAADSEGFVAYVDDFVDTVADRVDDTRDRWTNATTTSFTTVVAAGGLLALLYPTFTRGYGGVLSLFFCLVVATAVSLAAAMWARRERGFGAAVLAVTSLGWWAMTGAVLGGLFGSLPWVVAFAAVLVGVGGGVLRVAAGALAGPAALAWVVAALVLLSGIAVISGVGLLQVTSALILVCVLVLGVLPLTALGAGGLASIDYRIRAGQRLSNREIERAVSRASGILAWTLTAVGWVAASAAVNLALNAGTWPRVLAALGGVALLLRSRAYSRRTHALPLRLAGATVLLATFARFVLDREPGEVVLVVLFSALLVGVAMLSVIPVNEVLAARLRRFANYAEIIVVVVLVPLLASVFGLFSWVLRLLGA